MKIRIHIKIFLLALVLLLPGFLLYNADVLGADPLVRCTCSGVCNGAAITEQAVKRSLLLEGEEGETCCDVCKEIWAQSCGGYANCRETTEAGCIGCCSKWCKGIVEGGAKSQCMAACKSNCMNLRWINEAIELVSMVAIVIAAVLFLLHALALITSFGPYERSNAKTGIKYVIIALVLLVIAANFAGFLFEPFRSPGGATTSPVCAVCTEGSGGEVKECSDYDDALACVYDACNIGEKCYVDEHNHCRNCVTDPPGGCGGYGMLSCEPNTCGIATPGDGDGDGDGGGGGGGPEESQYMSVYNYGQNVVYCSQTPCNGESGCEESSIVCGSVVHAPPEYNYEHPQFLKGFKDLYNLNDPKRLCRIDYNSGGDCPKSDEGGSLYLHLSTLHAPGRNIVIDAFPDKFRIFIPPGTMYAGANIYMPNNAVEGFNIRYQQPPDGEYMEYAGDFAHYDDVPWEVDTFLTLDKTAQKDVYVANSDGFTHVVTPFAVYTPFTTEDSGWLYIQKLPFSSGTIHDFKVTIEVDLDTYLSWYNNVGEPGSDYSWDADGNPVKISGGGGSGSGSSGSLGDCKCREDLFPGYDNFCSICGPCGEYEGPCKSDNECSGSLVCDHRSGRDFCITPEEAASNPTWSCPFPEGHHSYCTVCKATPDSSESFCFDGEGWCASNRQHCIGEGISMRCDEDTHTCARTKGPGITCELDGSGGGGSTTSDAGCVWDKTRNVCVNAGGGGGGDGDGDGGIVIPDDGIPLVESGFQEGGTMGGTDVHCPAGTPVYYKFVCCIADRQHGIQVIGSPYSNTGGERYIVVKRGSPPTVEEIEYIRAHPFEDQSHKHIYWSGANSGTGGLMVEIRTPTPKSLWYAAFYSPEDTTLGHISISCLTPLSECGGGDGDGDGYKCINPVSKAIQLKEGLHCDEPLGDRPLCGGGAGGNCGYNRRYAGVDQYFYNFRDGEKKLFYFYTAGVDSGSTRGLRVQFTTLSGYSSSPYRRILKYAGPNCEYGPPTDEEIQAVMDYYQGSDRWNPHCQCFHNHQTGVTICPSCNNIVINGRHFFYNFAASLTPRMEVTSNFPPGCWYLLLEHDITNPPRGSRDKSPPVAISWSTPCCVRGTCISDMGLC